MSPIPRKPTDPDYGLTLLAYGWWVRLCERVGEQRVVHQRSFPARDHGGMRGAKRAARTWRDQLLARLPQQARRNGRVPTLRPLRPSRAGLAGVQLVVKRQQGRTDPYFVAWATVVWDQNRRSTQHYNVRKYGWRGAYLWAAYYRGRAVDEPLTLDALRALRSPSAPAELRIWLETHGCFRRVRYSDFDEPQ